MNREQWDCVFRELVELLDSAEDDGETAEFEAWYEVLEILILAKECDAQPI